MRDRLSFTLRRRSPPDVRSRLPSATRRPTLPAPAATPTSLRRSAYSPCTPRREAIHSLRSVRSPRASPDGGPPATKREHSRRRRDSERALAEVAAIVGGGGGAPDRFARAFASSASLGVPLASRLRALSDDIRDRSSVRLAEDVRRASMRVLLPLSLLVLPAFVLACLV